MLVCSGDLFRVFSLFMPCAHPLLHVIPTVVPPVLSFRGLYLWSKYLFCSKPLCTDLDTSASKKTPGLFWLTQIPPIRKLCALLHPSSSPPARSQSTKLLSRSWISFYPRVSQQWHQWHLGLDGSSCGGCGEGALSCALWGGEQCPWLLLIRLQQDLPLWWRKRKTSPVENHWSHLVLVPLFRPHRCLHGLLQQFHWGSPTLCASVLRMLSPEWSFQHVNLSWSHSLHKILAFEIPETRQDGAACPLWSLCLSFIISVSSPPWPCPQMPALWPRKPFLFSLCSHVCAFPGALNAQLRWSFQVGVNVCCIPLLYFLRIRELNRTRCCHPICFCFL